MRSPFLVIQFVGSRTENTRCSSRDSSAIFRKHVSAYLCHTSLLLPDQAGSHTKITVSNESTINWSTKLHLFLYRFVSSLKFDNRSASTKPKDKPRNASVPKTFEFVIEAAAKVGLQLSTNCRYYESERE